MVTLSPHLSVVNTDWSHLTKKGQTTEFVHLAKYLCVRDYMQKPYRYRLENIMAVYFLLKRE